MQNFWGIYWYFGLTFFIENLYECFYSIFCIKNFFVYNILYDFISILWIMKDIFLSGIQWSGKWTQADLLMEKFPDKFKYFETWGIVMIMRFEIILEKL